MKSLFPPLTALALVANQSLAADTSFMENWDLDEDGVVTWTELEKLQRKIFEAFDADGDGALNSEEYTAFDHARSAAAEKSGHPVAKRAVHGFSRDQFDKNLDGKVTRDEFETEMRDWFMSLDGNKDGVLGVGDF